MARFVFCTTGRHIDPQNNHRNPVDIGKPQLNVTLGHGYMRTTAGPIGGENFYFGRHPWPRV